MNSKIYEDELTASVTQVNKQTAPSGNVYPFSSVSPMSFRHSTTDLLDATRIVSKKKDEAKAKHDSLLEKYKSDNYQTPKYKPVRVIGNGAFGKYNQQFNPLPSSYRLCF